MANIVDRLREMADLFEAQCVPHNEVLHLRAAANEIEQLRAGNRDLQLWWDNLRPDHARLEAENAKLRAALEEINRLVRKHPAGVIANAALGGENGRK